MKKCILLLVCILSASILLAKAGPKTDGRKPKTGSLTIHFKNIVGGSALRLNDSASSYKNANGDEFKITTFKYYISNIKLTDKAGNIVDLPETYLLVNAADSTSLTQQIADVPAGKYTAISFIIGVDSLRNFAGAQTGALDPAKGMFWSWNSGYIFVKLEGVSPRSASKKNRLTFHIGGAKYPDNTIRSFSKPFDKTLKIGAGTQTGIELIADAAALFKGKTTIDFSKLSFTMGGPNSVIVADNYADGLFQLGKISK